MYIKLLSLGIIGVLLSCGTQENSTDTKKKQKDPVSVISPIEGVDNAKVTYRINVQNPEPIELKRGGSLLFDKDAFVDVDGNVVKGEVDIQWEEFHTFGDIMLSGIPMKYDSAGVANNLESGGMFTINGSQGDNPVHFAPNKSAEVNLASIQDTPCYNFYELDEASGDWVYEATATGTDRDEPEVDEVEDNITEAASSVDPNLIDVTLNTRDFDGLKDLEIVAWRAKRELSSFDKNMLRMTHTKTRLLTTDSLGLTLEARTYDKQVFQYPVEPYLMEEAIADSKTNRKVMEEGIAEVSEYLADVETGKVIRSIEIDNFGTFNWDCIHQFDEPQRVIASFDFPTDVNPDLISVFLLSPDENVVIRCNSKGDGSFFDPNLRNCLIGILPNNEIVSISDDGFNAVRGQKGGKSYTFAFKETGIKLKSPSDIMNHMNALI
jgi:hypothetical protein